MVTKPGPTGAAMEQLEAIAVAAGDAAMAFYATPCEVELKADSSPLTLADRASHDAIAKHLAAWDDSIPIISEEGSIPPYEERQAWRRFWLVDPLDGTKEFISRNGEFTVNIALIEQGEPVLGVVAAPALETVYVAARGCGGWRRINGSPPERLQHSAARPSVLRVVESRSHPSPDLEAYLATLGRIERVRIGSSLKFCLVAEGTADLYPRFGRTMEWDVAAGDCVYRHSGPSGTTRPSPLAYNQPTLSTPRFIIGRERV